MPTIKFLSPDALGKPLGQYSHMAKVNAFDYLFIAGQVAVDASGNLVGADDFDAQCKQTFANIETALKSQGRASPTWSSSPPIWCTRRTSRNFMKFRLREFPRMFPSGAYPPNTLLIVDRLVQESFLVEVKVTAAV